MSGTRAGRSARRPWRRSWGFPGPRWTGCLQNSRKQNKGQGFVGVVIPKSQNRHRGGMTGITSGTVFSHDPKIPLFIKYFSQKVMKTKMPYYVTGIQKSHKNMGKWDIFCLPVRRVRHLAHLHAVHQTNLIDGVSIPRSLAKLASAAAASGPPARACSAMPTTAGSP